MKVKIRFSADNPRFARVDGVSFPLIILDSPSAFLSFKAESISFYATRTRAETACDALGNDASWLLFYLTGGGEWRLLAESYQACGTYPNVVRKVADMVAYHCHETFYPIEL